MVTSSEAMIAVKSLPWPTGLDIEVAPDLSELTLFYQNIHNVCKTPGDLRKLRECTDYAMDNLRKVNPSCLLIIL